MSFAKGLRKPKDPVLIVEDTLKIQELLYDICKDIGVKTIIAENGKEALKILETQTFSIYVVDLMMPVMGGREFIARLKEREPDAIIIIQTALDTSETIIEVMKLGVFDYVIKPINLEHFQAVLKKAMEFKYLADAEKYQSQNASEKIRSQLEWLQYKEKRRFTDKSEAGIQSLQNLKDSLSQGAGAGSVLTLIAMLKASIEKQGENVLVDGELMTMLLENAEMFEVQLKGLKETLDILQEEHPPEETDTHTLNSEIETIAAPVLPYLASKQIEITFPVEIRNLSISVNRAILRDSILELLINACKYSSVKGKIDVFTRINEGYFWISVLNTVEESNVIPVEQEKLVSESFYRILPADESVRAIEKFGLGLGLTVVENVARIHGGIFLIKTVKDHLRTGVKNCVLAEILLPVSEK